MKRDTIYLTLLCTAMLTILLCAPVLAEGGRGGGMGGGRNTDLTSIWAGLLSLKFILGGLAALSGLILLKMIRINRNIRTLLMCAVFMLFGMLVVMHQPSPLRAVVDSLTAVFTGGGITSRKATMLIFIGGLSIIGSKLFCGWVCPFGALQEIVNRIPAPIWKKIKIPFKISNSIRVLPFAISLVMVLITGSDLYTYHGILNPFELFDWHFELALVVLVGAVLIASIFVYRPFCYLVCPVGLLTWLLEHVSIFRVRLLRERCNDCNKCIRMSPCPSVKAILNGDKLLPDCFACGVCISACPKDALEFGFWRSKS
jgi:polyferredoxin